MPCTVSGRYEFAAAHSRCAVGISARALLVVPVPVPVLVPVLNLFLESQAEKHCITKPCLSNASVSEIKDFREHNVRGTFLISVGSRRRSSGRSSTARCRRAPGVMVVKRQNSQTAGVTNARHGDVELPMGKDRSWEVKAHFLESLPLRLVNGHGESEANGKLKPREFNGEKRV